MDKSKPSFLWRLLAWLKHAGQAVIRRRAWLGAALGMLVAALLFILPADFSVFGHTDAMGLVIGFGGYLLVALVAGMAVWLLVRLLTIPPGFLSLSQVRRWQGFI